MNPYLLYQKSCVVKPVSVKNSVIEQHLRLAKHGTVKNQVSKKNKDKKYLICCTSMIRKNAKLVKYFLMK